MKAGIELQEEEKAVSLRVGVREFTLAEDIAHFAVC
jgi:hypothetical protein